MEKQVLESPFTKKDFLELAYQVSDSLDMRHDYFGINNSSIVNIGSWDFIYY